MAKDAETIKRTFGQDIGSFFDDVPPAKKVKTGGDKEQGDRVDVERTLDGAIKIKEERDSWGRVKESFDEVSEGTTVISNVAYYSSYDLPEPVDLRLVLDKENNTNKIKIKTLILCRYILFRVPK